MKKACITVDNIVREFRLAEEIVRALKGIAFTIYEGEFAALMGTSGSGKTTLLNILGCLDRPTSGSYKLADTLVSASNLHELAQIRNSLIGFVFQAYNLLPRTSALENVELPLFYNHEIHNKERRERAQYALEMVKLQDRMHHTPAQLSGGQQQRVAIARALVNDPVVIFADEATGNLDTRTSYEIMTLFQELNGKGKTICFVTHESDIASFCSRHIRLRDGLIVEDAVIIPQLAVDALNGMPTNEDYISK
ncbi:MAG: ABC transporter ATP-binding protein [Chitinispirillales bacterium]|jgi:putative ABC transport system ATP-binding protein|nr:ABC transporter ATP-binding protein [Chitinispirillales bacterium]